MSDLPFVSCLCPTYHRPSLLANAIALFERQTYPADRRQLLIMDDAGQYRPCSGPGWSLHSTSWRYHSLPAKYNATASMAEADVFMIWEDDDLYLPHAIEAHAKCFAAGAQWSKPSAVSTLYGTTDTRREDATGRFFASIAVSARLWRRLGGMEDTKRADFDQRFMAACERSGGSPWDTLAFDPDPGFVFRWQSTQSYHCQHKMRAPDDTTWWDAVAGLGDATPQDGIVPQLDEETARILAAKGWGNVA